MSHGFHRSSVNVTVVVDLLVGGSHLGSRLNNFRFETNVWSLHYFFGRACLVTGIDGFVALLETLHVLGYDSFDLLLVLGVAVRLDEDLVDDLAKVGS